MRTVQFYELTRTIQTRFVECARGAGVPAPLAAEPQRFGPPVLWGLGALAAFGAMLAFASMGYGKLESGFALDPPWTIAVYVVFGAIGMFCAVEAASHGRVERSHPYRSGIYVFPVGVIDARKLSFEVHPVSDLARAEVAGTRVRAEFQGGRSFQVSAGSRQRAEAAVKALQDAKAQLEEAEATHNRRTLALLDPLQDTGFSNPFSPTVSFRRPKPMNPVAAVVVAAASGVGLAVAVWLVRNKLSEERMFLAASTQNDTPSWRSYLKRGGKRRDAADIFLPRAELRDARKAGSVAAMEKYVAAHPNTKIKSEVDAALRAALLEELADARKQGTLRAVHQFATHYARYDVIRGELEEAKFSVYADALQKFKDRSPDAELEEFVARLLDYARKHGSTAHVQFVRQVPDSHHIVDMVVRKSTYFRGTESIPSQYFDEPHELPRQKAAGERIVKAVQDAFPVDVLHFELLPPVTMAKGELPETKVPTLFIEYKTELSGGFLSNLPRAIFVGAGAVLRANFTIPGDKQAWSVKYSSWKPPDVAIMREEGKGTPDVYEDMARTGYDGFLEKLLARFEVKKPAPPPQAPPPETATAAPAASASASP